MTAPIPEFRSARCVRFRYRYSECDRCLEACPHGAVELSDKGIEITQERCQNCGLCASACRTGALTAADLPRIPILKHAIGRTRFSFACAPSGLEGDAVVPCLGAIEAAMLAYLAKRGIETELRGSHHCAACAHGATGARELALHLEGVEQLAQAALPEEWKLPVALQPHLAKEAGAGFTPARRQLFRRLVGRGVDVFSGPAAPGAEMPAPEKAIRAGPLHVTETRELLQIVCKAKSGAAFEVRPHPSLPIAGLELDAGCTACEACFRACPTGALQVRETDASWMLTFDADRCLACEVCREVCQPGVLRVADSLDASPGRGETALHRLAKQRCGRCDRSFVSAEHEAICPVCCDDEEAFEAIFG